MACNVLESTKGRCNLSRSPRLAEQPVPYQTPKCLNTTSKKVNNSEERLAETPQDRGVVACIACLSPAVAASSVSGRKVKSALFSTPL